MSRGDGIDFHQAELVLARLAEIAAPLAYGAGVGELETVGHIVSYLLDHPYDIEPCLRFGLDELPADWIEQGNLSYHARDGRIVRPEHARRARAIKKMERAGGDDAR